MVRFVVNAPPLITLTTDFGLKDAYVGVMKGVVLAIEPRARVIDLSHEIEPHGVAEGAFLLRTAFRYFPPDAIHVAVVDPGVGTSRKAVAIETAHGIFIGPDNGLFTHVLADQNAVSGDDEALRGVSGVELINPQYRLEGVSNTFHGRDVFAPAAAHYARGVQLGEFGPPIKRVALLPNSIPISRGTDLVGMILHLDRFGNAISNLRAHDLPATPVFEIAGTEIEGLSASYQDSRLNVLIGSSGFVEVAVQNGSAAGTLGLSTGDTILVRDRT
jgi:S-adenosyl-L-methionine hydrolase (adenosine-forming)